MSAARVKLEKVGSATDTKISVADKMEKIPSSIIECSVNTSVFLSNAKRSKIFQRTQSLLIVILAIIFAILCFHLKREVRALEVQMNCVNSNLMMLMLRYDKLNKHFNRSWYHRWVGNEKLSEILDSASKYRRTSTSTSSSSSWSSSRQESKNSSSRSRVKSTTTVMDEPLLRRNPTAVNAQRPLDKSSKLNIVDNTIEEARSIEEVEREDAKSSDRERYERAIVAFERRNHAAAASAATTALPALRDDITDDDTITWNEPRAGRSRRDEGRGKQRRKIKRKLKRSRRRLGPLVATFVGAVPEQHVTDTVYVGPWVKSTRNESRYAFNKFHLVEDKTSIEVTTDGLYMVSAQIYYFGEPTHYSYWILLSSEGTSHTEKVIKCATVSAVSATEASCYTSVVLPLRRGDRLHIQQQERNRLINLREGHSYVQIMLLSDESPRRRAS